MSKVRAPLLSFGARGAIAKSIVFAVWKGIDYAREYVTPANPRTAAQIAQRALLTQTTGFWRNVMTDGTERPAWDRAAGLDSRPMSGFNIFSSNGILMQAIDPAASFSISIMANTGFTAKWACLNLDDFATGDEAGNFDVFVGPTPTDLSLESSPAIAGGEVVSGVLGIVDDVVYVQLRKSDLSRSGIAKITLIA